MEEEDDDYLVGETMVDVSVAVIVSHCFIEKNKVQENHTTHINGH